jgi:glycosyltransferase involved in cell wall biosynthesis
MNSFPSISVIVPVYQVADYIGSCLASVAAQDYPGRLECIVVDDCGSDNSMEIVRDFIGGYSGGVAFIQLAHDRNRGLSAARNTGMARAGGDYVFFLDSDDELAPGALKGLAEPLVDKRFDIVAGRVLSVGSDVDYNCRYQAGTVLSGREVKDAYAGYRINAMACNKLYRRQLLLDNSMAFYEGIIHEDELWSFELSLVARSLLVSGVESYIYRFRAGSITGSRRLPERIGSLQVIFREMCAYADVKGLLGDEAVHTKTERFRRMILRQLLGDWKWFRKEYARQRKDAPKKWGMCLKANGFRLKKQLRDLHLALPSTPGAAYLYCWLALEKEFA